MSSAPNQGFGLVEVMVSVLFLMIAISGLMTTYSYMSSQVERTRWKRSALHIAQQKIEEFMANPDKSYKSSEEIEVPVTSFYSPKSTMEIKKDPIDPSIIESFYIIECRIRWPDKNDVSVSLKTIVRN